MDNKIIDERLFNEAMNNAENLVRNEVDRSYKLFPGFFASEQEFLAVLWEEFEEVKTEVFKRERDLTVLRKEVVQVAAMALRWLAENESVNPSNTLPNG